MSLNVRLYAMIWPIYSSFNWIYMWKLLLFTNCILLMLSCVCQVASYASQQAWKRLYSVLFMCEVMCTFTVVHCYDKMYCFITMIIIWFGGSLRAWIRFHAPYWQFMHFPPHRSHKLAFCMLHATANVMAVLAHKVVKLECHTSKSCWVAYCSLHNFHVQSPHLYAELCWPKASSTIQCGLSWRCMVMTI